MSKYVAKVNVFLLWSFGIIKKIYIVSEFVDQNTNSTGYFWFKIISALSLKFTNVTALSTQESCQLAAKDNDKVVYISAGNFGDFIGNGLIGKLISNFILSIRLAIKTIKAVKKNEMA